MSMVVQAFIQQARTLDEFYVDDMVHLFESKALRELMLMGGDCRITEYKQAQEIIMKGSPAKEMHVLLHGRVIAESNGKHITRGTMFGEQAFLTTQTKYDRDGVCNPHPHKDTLVVESKTAVCLTMTYKSCLEAHRAHVNMVISRMKLEPWERLDAEIDIIAEVLQPTAKIFSEMDPDTFRSLCKRAHLKSFPRGKLMTKQGTSVSSYIYILKGSAVAVDEQRKKSKVQEAGDLLMRLSGREPAGGEGEQEKGIDIRELMEGDIIPQVPPPNTIAVINSATAFGEGSLTSATLRAGCTIVSGAEFDPTGFWPLDDQRDGVWAIVIPRETYVEACQPGTKTGVDGMQDVTIFLRQIGVLSKMGEKYLQQLAFNLSPMLLNPHSSLVKQGDLVDKIYIIRSGSLSVYQSIPEKEKTHWETIGEDFGTTTHQRDKLLSFKKKKTFRTREKAIGILGPGALIGAKELVSSSQHGESIRTDATVELLWCHAELFRELFQQVPDLEEQFMQYRELFVRAENLQKEKIVSAEPIVQKRSVQPPLVPSPPKLSSPAKDASDANPKKNEKYLTVEDGLTPISLYSRPDANTSSFSGLKKDAHEEAQSDWIEDPNGYGLIRKPKDESITNVDKHGVVLFEPPIVLPGPMASATLKYPSPGLSTVKGGHELVGGGKIVTPKLR